MTDAGFALAEDHRRVWAPTQGNRVVASGPVITWASRTRNRQLSSLAASALLRRVLRPMRVVRIAVHPGDNGVPRLLESIDRSFTALCPGRTPGRYGDLLS